MDLTVAETISGILDLYTIGFTLIALVSSIQAGLSLMEAGYSRKHNVSGVLVKNVHQLAVGILMFWLVGYAFGMGNVKNGFIGNMHFAGKGWVDTWRFLDAAQYGFLGMIVVFSVNIPLAERCQGGVQMLYAGLIMAFMYPVVVAWHWGDGWLNSMFQHMRDPGGCLTVHLLAGIISIVGIFLTGKRHRYGDDTDWTPGHVSLASIGMLLFAIGLFFINAFRAPDMLSACKGAFNTWLAGGTCSLLVTLGCQLVLTTPRYRFHGALEGFLGGMIAVSSCANNTHGWGAFCIGWFVGVFVLLTIILEVKAKLDDPAHTIAWQYVAAFIGSPLAGFFDDQDGVFHWGSGDLIGVNLLGVVVITAWGLLFAVLLFGLARVSGVLLVPKEIQDEGLIKGDIGVLGIRRAPYSPLQEDS